MKFNKRAKEFTRISRYYRHFTAGQVTVNIFDPGSEKETYDGQTIIRPSFFKKMARNKADRLHLEHHGKNGSFRLLSDRGLIKGDFIVARSDEDLDYDVVTSSDNLKHELCFEDEQYFCTFFLHHDHHAERKRDPGMAYSTTIQVINCYGGSTRQHQYKSTKRLSRRVFKIHRMPDSRIAGAVSRNCHHNNPVKTPEALYCHP